MEMETRVQILDKVVCISRSAKILKKSMHPTIQDKVEGLGKYIHFNIYFSKAVYF